MRLMRCRVVIGIVGSSRKERDTVIWLTFALSATVAMVTREGGVSVVIGREEVFNERGRGLFTLG